MNIEPQVYSFVPIPKISKKKQQIESKNYSFL